MISTTGATMASIYELKMPAFLAMSKGDLIAEIIEKGNVVSEHLAEQQKEPATDIMEAIMLPSPDAAPSDVRDANEVVRIANDVLRERFGITIQFHYGQYGF
jgi:hypothetical protein